MTEQVDRIIEDMKKREKRNILFMAFMMVMFVVVVGCMFSLLGMHVK